MIHFINVGTQVGFHKARGWTVSKHQYSFKDIEIKAS